MSAAAETSPEGGTSARWSHDRIVAESSLLGERAVSVVRLAMIAIFGLSQGIVAPAMGEGIPLDAIMKVTLGAYMTAAVSTFLLLRWQRPDPGRARVIPLLIATVDFAFIAVMGWRGDAIVHRPFPEMAAAACALVLTWSVARFHEGHVAWSTFLACVTYLVVPFAHGNPSPIPTTYVIGAFLALGLFIGWTNARVRRMFLDVRRRDTLMRFLPRQVVDRVLATGEVLEPVQREVTVLFTDIRGFTAFSERMPPRDLLDFLDRFHGQAARIVKRHEGIVLKFLGDGMLAAWGVPDARDDHAVMALDAALALREWLVDFNTNLTRDGRPVVAMGVGVHSGVVAAGMLGGEEQHEYTVIGDAVNVASRVEGLTRTLGADVLATERTWMLAAGRFDGERAGEERVKGRTEPVVVYAVRRRKA